MAQNKQVMSSCHWGWKWGAKPPVRHMPDGCAQWQSRPHSPSTDYTHSQRHYVQQMAEMAKFVLLSQDVRNIRRIEMIC